MASSTVFPSGTNTFAPSVEASHNLVVDFGRNANDFAVNRYTQIAPVKNNVGLYVLMTVEQAGRILNSDLANFAWYDGQTAPEHNDGTESFQMPSFATKRYNYGFNLGDLSIDQATWDILAQNSRIAAQQAMTGRTQLSITALTTAANYASTHTSDVASIAGNTGKWTLSTTARQDIQRSLHTAANQIKLDTLSAVKENELIVVISPDCARQIRVCQEIVDYIKGSYQALAQVRGELPGRNVTYGLPDKLYGYELVIEDAVKVTSRKGATKVSSYVLPGTTAFMCARPGSLVAPSSEGPNFSTCTLFMKEEFTVEVERENWHRRTKGRVVEDLQAVMTAPVTGYLFTNVT